MVIAVPMTPDEGAIDVNDGFDKLVNGTSLLRRPLTSLTTATVPGTMLKALAPRRATIFVSLQLWIALYPEEPALNITLPVPGVAPKLLPKMDTLTFWGAELGDRLAITAGAPTTKGIPVLCMPFTLTTTLPDVADEGTGTTI